MVLISCIETCLAKFKSEDQCYILNFLSNNHLLTFAVSEKQPKLEADVLFVIDSSYEVSQEDFKIEKNFIKSLVRSLNMSSDSSRTALISYGDRASLTSRFIDLQSLIDFDKSVDNASYIGGDRRIDKAVEMVSRLLNEAGGASSKVVIFLTAGRQASSGRPLEDVVQPLRQNGAKTYVIAIRKQTDVQDLRPLVDTSEDVVRVLSFKELDPEKTRIANHISEKAGKRQNLLIFYCFKVGGYEATCCRELTLQQVTTSLPTSEIGRL